MLSLMPLFTFCLCVGYAFSVYYMIVAAADAPIGYEDAEGFHYGLQPVRAGRS